MLIFSKTILWTPPISSNHIKQPQCYSKMLESNQPSTAHTASRHLPFCPPSNSTEKVITRAILDSGATSHYIMTTAPVWKKIPAVSPITFTLPDGTRVSSIHEYKLSLHQLPAAARFIHILLSLASHSLLSVVKLCNTGCDVSFKDIACKVQYRGKLILSGSK